MFYFLLVITTLVFILLLVVAAIRPHHSELNQFELERRSELGDKQAEHALAREKMLGDVVSLQRVLIAILQVAVVILSEITFGIYIGILVALIVALVYGSIARLGIIKKLAHKLYGSIEKSLLKFIPSAKILVKFLRSAPMSSGSHVLHIDSRQELQHLVAESSGVLSPEEKKIIVSGLSFNDQLVRDIMTPSNKIISIKKSEYLGPLTLDELYKSGHSRLPVISTNLDHIVGVLHLEGLLALDVKRSTTVEKAMEQKVFYVRQDQPLSEALTAMLDTNHYLFIVVNNERETVGLITLKDVIEALTGHEVVGNTKGYNSLHEVAERKNI